MIILVDNREQLPWAFERIPKRKAERRASDTTPYVEVTTAAATLNVGDYMVSHNRNPDEAAPISIDRKSKADLFGTLTSGRDRFYREVERAADLQIALHIVIEDSWEGLRTPPTRSTVSPLVIKRTLISLSAKYGVHYHCPGDRAKAEQVAYRILEFAWQAHANRFNHDVIESGEH